MSNDKIAATFHGRSTAEVTLAMHPHAFAVIVLEHPADANYGCDVAIDDRVITDELFLAMLRGVVVSIERRVAG